MSVVVAGVLEGVVDVAALTAAVGTAGDGAVVSFAGVVRDHDHGRSVTELEYQAHPSAGAVVAEVAATIAARFPAVRIAVQHRVGTLRIGDVALGAAVASAHRREAFAACSDLVDLVKERLPVWKRQVFTDGTDEWVGST